MTEEADRNIYPDPKLATGSVVNPGLLPHESSSQKPGRSGTVDGLNTGHW